MSRNPVCAHAPLSALRAAIFLWPEEHLRHYCRDHRKHRRQLDNFDSVRAKIFDVNKKSNAHTLDPA